jgi:CheY-like chemotaxis protein
MASTILHVEDDLALRGLVKLAFESFGFRGTIISANSVSEAKRRLERAARSDDRIDLIISDMNLPDGTGLDIVRDVRASQDWRTTPVLILSGDINPRIVDKAYALGANAYLDKSPRGRSLSELLRSLYQHWTHDVVFPLPPAENERVHRLVSRAISIRRRHAELYQHLAELFSDSRAEATFWLSRALVESNLINVLAFLRNAVHDRDLPETAFEEITSMQEELETLLTQGERRLALGSLTRDAAYELTVDLVTSANLVALSKHIHNLSPQAAAAVGAFQDFLASTVHDVAAWVDLHATDPTLHERAAHMQTRLAALTSAS